MTRDHISAAKGVASQEVFHCILLADFDGDLLLITARKFNFLKYSPLSSSAIKHRLYIALKHSYTLVTHGHLSHQFNCDVIGPVYKYMRRIAYTICRS